MISVAVKSIKRQRKIAKANLERAQAELAQLDAALAALTGTVAAAPKKKRRMSAAARRKISAYQKARWAKVRAGK